MGKNVVFYAKDKALVNDIVGFQINNKIPSFAAAVRELCLRVLQMDEKTVINKKTIKKIKND